MTIENTSLSVRYNWKAESSSMNRTTIHNSPLLNLNSEIDFTLRTKLVNELSGLLRISLDESIASSRNDPPSLSPQNGINDGVEPLHERCQSDHYDVTTTSHNHLPLHAILEQEQQQHENREAFKRKCGNFLSSDLSSLTMERIQEEQRATPLKKRRRYARRNSATAAMIVAGFTLR